MPIYKFRTLDEMRRAQWLTPDDPRLPRIIRFNWQLAWEMSGRFVPPRGVFKFRSLDEASAFRLAWERERIEHCRQNSKLENQISKLGNPSRQAEH